MKFRTRRLVKAEDLNPRGTLFGGRCMQWLDEEAAIYAICQMGTTSIVTKIISEINFISPAHLGDIIEFGMERIAVGRTSLTFKCLVRNKDTGKVIVEIEKIVFVCVDENGNPTPHNVKIEENE